MILKLYFSKLQMSLKELILQSKSEGKSVKEISIILGETEAEIKLQLKQFALDMYLKKMTFSKIKKLTGVSDLEIIQFLILDLKNDFRKIRINRLNFKNLNLSFTHNIKNLICFYIG